MWLQEAPVPAPEEVPAPSPLEGPSEAPVPSPAESPVPSPAESPEIVPVLAPAPSPSEQVSRLVATLRLPGVSSPLNASASRAIQQAVSNILASAGITGPTSVTVGNAQVIRFGRFSLGLSFSASKHVMT